MRLRASSAKSEDLTADRTLMSPYRKLSLATFFGCAPAFDVITYHIQMALQIMPRTVFAKLKQVCYGMVLNVKKWLWHIQITLKNLSVLILKL